MTLKLVKTICLDLGGTTGYVVGGAGGIDFSGSRQLPKTAEDYGEYACAFRGWLTRLVQEQGIKRIIYEAPIMDPKNGLIAFRKMNALTVMTEVIARDNGAECFECHLAQIRRYFIGMVRAPEKIGAGETKDRRAAVRRQWMKSKISYECRQRGFNPKDDNEADALAMWCFQRELLDPLKTLSLLAEHKGDADATAEDQEIEAAA